MGKDKDFSVEFYEDGEVGGGRKKGLKKIKSHFSEGSFEKKDELCGAKLSKREMFITKVLGMLLNFNRKVYLVSLHNFFYLFLILYFYSPFLLCILYS